MPTAYPAGIDDFGTIPSGAAPRNAPVAGRTHFQIHNDANLAVIALETKVGIAGSADPTSIEYRLSQLEYVAPDISALTNNVGTVEIGTTVNDVTLSWLLNKVMASLSIASPGPGAITPSLLTYALSSLGLTSNQTFTVTAGDGVGTDAATTTVYFQHRRRYGVSATATPDSVLIDALAGAEFATSRVQSRTMVAAAEYLYFAWPSSWSGSPIFTVNGLEVSGWVKTTISYTNPSGNTTNFDAYRSPYSLTGTYLVTVS